MVVAEAGRRVATHDPLTGGVVRVARGARRRPADPEVLDGIQPMVWQPSPCTKIQSRDTQFRGARNVVACLKR
jgi:hypothetical protein